MTDRKRVSARDAPPEENICEILEKPIPLPKDLGDDETDWYTWYFDTYATIGELEDYAGSEGADPHLATAARARIATCTEIMHWTERLIEHCYIEVPADVRERLLRKMLSERGRKAAEAKRASNAPRLAERREKLIAAYRSGRYPSKDQCAEKEYQNCGYPSIGAARKDLRGVAKSS